MNFAMVFRISMGDKKEQELLRQLQGLAKNEGLAIKSPQVADRKGVGKDGVVDKTAETVDGIVKINWDGIGIDTVEQLVEAANVDTDVWRVTNFRVNEWRQSSDSEVFKQLWSVKADFFRIDTADPIFNRDFDEGFEKTCENLRQSLGIVLNAELDCDHESA